MSDQPKRDVYHEAMDAIERMYDALVPLIGEAGADDARDAARGAAKCALPED